MCWEPLRAMVGENWCGQVANDVGLFGRGKNRSGQLGFHEKFQPGFVVSGVN